MIHDLLLHLARAATVALVVRFGILPPDNDRDLAVRQHFHRFTAHDERNCFCPSMRGHAEGIATLFLRRLDDRLVRALVKDVDPFEGNAGRFSGFPDNFKKPRARLLQSSL
jgi:hypothetical protein